MLFQTGRARTGVHALLLAVGIACAPLTAAEVLSVPGSGNPEFLLGRLADAYNAAQSTHRVVIPPSTGTAGALRDLDQGHATLGRVGRPLSDAEKRKGLTYLPIGRDAVVFVAGSGVTLQSVTAAQIVDIYTGKIVDWRELGAKAGPIRAIGRETTDASRQAIGREIKAFENIVFGDSVKVVHLDPQMIELLDRHGTSLGFLNQSALHAAKTPLVKLAFDGVRPDVSALASGRYPIFLEFGLVYRPETLTDAGKDFIRFIGSPAGQQVRDRLGVVAAAEKH